ncbi:uncharacterized protein G2W53_022262 [Senna tora]|uniref:Uncharacterized protein n=1 Tax=Senna tora TaxID=362788 RepID=A0A834WKB3_9FABA|nr:uncharacterized protein G2W53_022262 [Senna tora]
MTRRDTFEALYVKRWNKRQKLYKLI